MVRSLYRSPFGCLLVTLLVAAAAHAQPGPAPAVRPEGTSAAGEGSVLWQRPTVALPAEFQEAGLENPGALRLETGYEASFRSADARREHGIPLALRFAANRRLLLQLDLDALEAETDYAGNTESGVGNLRLGFQYLFRRARGQNPALAVAYSGRVPTGGAGAAEDQVRHKLLALVSTERGRTNVDLNLGYLGVRRGGGGWTSGAYGALSVERELENGFGAEMELSGQTHDDELPRGAYAVGALTYEGSSRVTYDVGVRFGLTSGTPRFGAFVGLSIGIGDFFKSRP